MGTGTPFWIQRITEELQTRRASNPQYSLRTFAKDIGIHPAILSLALKGKRALPQRHLPVVLSNINLNEEEKERFVNSTKKTECQECMQ